MAFSVNNGPRSSLAEINVTPLVDVMLVLLVIFMITVPVIQSGIQVQVPHTHQTNALTQNLMVVTIDRSGNVYLGDKITSVTTIANDLKKMLASRKQNEIYVRADEHVAWGTLARVMDAIKVGGLNNVQMVTQPFDRTPK